MTISVTWVLVRRDFGKSCTDSPVNHGDRGGLMVNDRGALVAVVSHSKVGEQLVSGNIDIEEVRKFLSTHLPLP